MKVCMAEQLPSACIWTMDQGFRFNVGTDANPFQWSLPSSSAVTTVTYILWSQSSLGHNHSQFDN